MSLTEATPNHYKTLIEDKLASAKKGKAYCEQCLANPGLQAWELKEYKAVLQDRIDEIAALEERLANFDES
jgi:hypothetical protein